MSKGEVPIKAALRTEVEAGELLSIRPVGLEHRYSKTYAPVLKRLDWQFALPERIQSTVI